MFFYLSKVLWFFVDPGNLLFLGLVIGVIFIWSRRRRLARWLLTATAFYALVLAVLPLGDILLVTLENRFPRNTDLPENVEGIIVLGGVVDQFVSKDRGTVEINGAVDRLTAFARLAKKFPQARLVFTGGSGALFDQGLKEAHFVAPIFTELGITLDRIIFEDQSRNTAENATFSRKLANPSDEGQWMLITSAFHIPRAMGAFRQAGWKVKPYPVDYHLKSNVPLGVRFSFRGGMGSLAAGLHEWIGLTFYWLTGRTNEFFPGPLEVVLLSQTGHSHG